MFPVSDLRLASQSKMRVHVCPILAVTCLGHPGFCMNYHIKICGNQTAEKGIYSSESKRHGHQ